ncbi:conserved hypothetical protein [Pediculus humanus corporis]|uniref:Coiled-coil domain-containing protein 40 n=1 Tax=Pediculus humanus subsp. corporis TaxID=121224 RepID=E0VHG2_PEDHC|nr:uncharacterized protein Phum_PHUM208760 [Pediculus humanus corporis]EEB12818.1 conserved hypothetical protein [Pediculus humanus corporis]
MDTLVLEPDHPMMEKFQIALKNHLLKQIGKLDEQIFEMNLEIKRKEKEKEETGVELYTFQQEIFRQQKILDEFDAVMDNLIKERETLDKSVKSKKITWKEEVDRLNCAKKKEMVLAQEFKKLSTIEKQMEEWEKEMESELTISQRISEKTAADKIKLVDEKRKMDMYLLKLMLSVSHFETELKEVSGEIDLKLEEKDSLSQTLADSSADLHALMSEQSRLTSAWNSVAIAIKQKNNIYLELMKELKQVNNNYKNTQDAFHSLNVEIESYKKSSAEEMKKNEKLVVIIGRGEREFENGQITLRTLNEKKIIAENKITATAAMITRSEYELTTLKATIDKIQQELNSLKIQYEKYVEEHNKIQDEFLNFEQELLINDKTVHQLTKLIKETLKKNRAQEFSLIESENKISQRFLEVEELKEIIFRNNEIVKEGNNEITLKEEEIKTLEDEIEKCLSAIIQKQGNYATLTRKIEKQIQKSDYGKAWVSPSQQRVLELEKINAEIQAKNDKMQSFWLIHQNNNVKLSEQRTEQLKEISLLRKQILLFEQRSLKTERELQKEKEIEHEVNKTISHLQHKLLGLNEILVGKKGYRENLGKENALTQLQFVQNLKESELEQIRLKDEIKELENNLEELAETMLSTQREILAWEKKIKSAVEAKNEVQRQRSSAGELGQMKVEIHRMEVRYGQLKKVQEKLITDLEQCVLRRDSILDNVNAKERRNLKKENIRSVVQKKVDLLKNQLRTVHNEIKGIQTDISNIQEGQEDLRKTIQMKENTLMEMKETSRKINLRLEEGQLKKCLNLEILIRRQKKCKLYDLLKHGRYKLLFKNEQLLDNEIQKVKNKNQDLILVMELLIQDFPNYGFHLKKIKNTFQAPPS